MSSVSVRKHGDGFLLRYGRRKLGLDTGFEGGTTLLSHSHMDHVGGLKSARFVVGTAGTFDTLKARGGAVRGRKLTIGYGESYAIDQLRITALNAGHVLGSSMFKIEVGNGPSILYTGDFNTVDSLVHAGADTTDADVLVTEATYGQPTWVFPDRERVYNEIISEVNRLQERGKIPVLKAYSLGKAQETIALLNRAGIDVITGNYSIDAVCDMYARHGKKLQHFRLDDEKTPELLTRESVVVSSSVRYTLGNVRKRIDHNVGRELRERMAVLSLSGWTLGKYREKGFPLSAHTDFPGLVRFAKNVNPRLTYCFTENGKTLADHLSKNGVEAVPLE
ncbi:MAG: MBL fold metallo-hydrolase [Promethearchaeia archaeon]